MQLSENLALTRYEWAKQKVKSITDQYFHDKAICYDIGAGRNPLIEELKDETRIFRSFDMQPYNDTIEQWDIENEFPYNYPGANIITFLEIVEHLNNPWLCMKNISNVMAPGGFLVLTTPNPGWSSSRINLLIKGFLSCFTQSDLELNHHVFIAWPHILEKLLIDNNFEIVEYVTLDGKTKLFTNDIKLSSSLLQIPARMVKKAIEKSDPSSIGMSYGIIARKISETS
jgi:hypothetical protein